MAIILTKTKTRRLLAFALAASTLVAPVAPVEAKPDTLYQVSTLQALSLGQYNGLATFKELRRHGDFGLGALDDLNGEFILLDGKGWQARYDGRVLPVPGKERLPFAAVTHFRAQQRTTINAPLEYSSLQRQLDALLPTRNVPVAIKIHGRFSYLKIRSVPRQEQPFPLLSEIVKTQAEWEYRDISGTLVGFRFPQFLSGVNLADYHFHFISDDKTRGGHVLTGTLQNGTIELSALRNFEMQLSPRAEFDRADLGDSLPSH